MPLAYPKANSWNQITSSLISFLFNKDKNSLEFIALTSLIVTCFLGNKMGKKTNCLVTFPVILVYSPGIPS